MPNRSDSSLASGTPTLVHNLQTVALNTPEATSIVLQERKVSYAELWKEICNVAIFLRQHGLTIEDRVALLLENSLEYVVSYYGTLLAGGTVVALNPAAKSRTHLHIMKHSDACWLFTDTNQFEFSHIVPKLEKSCQLVLHGKLPKLLGRPFFSYSDIALSQTIGSQPPPMSKTENLAALIYTSGTTGDPKGVMLSHQNILANTESIIEYLELTASDSVLNVLPFNYSYGNSVLHTHLAVGASLVIENSLMYPKKVLERMSSERVTGFSGVPSTFALFLNRVCLKDYNLNSLRYMTQAGGSMPPAHIARITQELPNIKFIVMYGQTEASARLTFLPPDRLKEKPGSCGIAIPGVELKICTKDGQIAPTGKTGEIRARGENIMLGYWKNSQATARTLVDGWLCTGDLAHRDEEGYIFIDGRSTDMIKSGAHRISPQEIEEVISELETVIEVGVVGVPDELLGQIVKAVIVAGENLEKREVQRYCKMHLAQYKMPRQIVFTKNLPKTASGKIQRHLLRDISY